MTFSLCLLLANFIFIYEFHSSICLILSRLDLTDRILLHPDRKKLEILMMNKREVHPKETTSFDREKISHTLKEAFLEITTAIVIWTILH